MFLVFLVYQFTNNTYEANQLRLSSINKSQFIGLSKNRQYKVICYYYAVEAWYRTSRGMFLPEDIDASKCTHLHYAYTILNSETFLMEPSDKWAEIDNRFYEVR